MSIDIDVARRAVELARDRGASLAIARLQEKVQESIVFDSGVLKNYSISRVVGLGIRVVVDGGVGYSYTTDLSMDSIVDTVDRAIAIAKVVSRYRKRGFVEAEIVKDRFRTYVRIDPFEVDVEQKISLVAELNRYSMSKQGIVSAVTKLGIEKDKKIVVTSEGSEVEIEVLAVGISHSSTAKICDVAERVGNSKTFIGGFEHLERYDWRTFVEEIDSLAIKASQARTPPPGTYVAVIDNELIGLVIHEALGHASEGDNVVVGASVLRDKIGTKVASDLVTIVDEGVVEGGYPVPYDDEAVPKRRTVVVENGVLVSYLHSRGTAYELGQKSTGNARAQDITFDTTVRQTNFYMLPRDWRTEEMFEDIRFGIYLRGCGASGGQASSYTGTFTFSVGPSYIVRNGEPAELVRGVIVSGNILETLKNIDAVGRDLRIITTIFRSCSKSRQFLRVGFGGPHVRVRKVVVGGL